jgi:hypothetical protein
LVERAVTVAAANAQAFMLPVQLDDWRRFAMLLDGYAIAKELGYDLLAWGSAQDQRYRETSLWDLSVLELRLMVFYEQRADYWSGYTYHERDDIVDSLLREISQKTGLAHG